MLIGAQVKIDKYALSAQQPCETEDYVLKEVTHLLIDEISNNHLLTVENKGVDLIDNRQMFEAELHVLSKEQYTIINGRLKQIYDEGNEYIRSLILSIKDVL